MDFKKLEVKETETDNPVLTGSCLDCDWSGDMKDAEIDPCGDWDEFKGMNIPTPICPKCGGGIEVN